MAVGDATKWFTKMAGDPDTRFVSGSDGVAAITQIYTDFAEADTAQQITGTGQPNGVVTGVVGQKYVDTAATAGAVEWVKVSGSGNTGWVVTVGDTGWREFVLTPSATFGTQSGVTFELALLFRRTAVNSYVRAAARRTVAYTGSADASAAYLGTIPSGLRSFIGYGGITLPASASTPVGIKLDAWLSDGATADAAAAYVSYATHAQQSGFLTNTWYPQSLTSGATLVAGVDPQLVAWPTSSAWGTAYTAPGYGWAY